MISKEEIQKEIERCMDEMDDPEISSHVWKYLDGYVDALNWVLNDKKSP